MPGSGQQTVTFTGVVESWPRYDFVWVGQYMVGDCYKHSKRKGVVGKEKANAAIRYQEYVERYPDSRGVVNALFLIGECCEKVGDNEAAVETYRGLLDVLEPGDRRRGKAESKIAELGGEGA